MARSIAIAALLLATALPASAQAPGSRERAAASAAADAALAAQRAAYNAMPDTPGTGPYPARMEEDPALPGFVFYRPAALPAGKARLGLVIWGNGACSDDGASARLHLAEIASHGFLVIAPGRIMSGPAAPPSPTPYWSALKTTTADMRRALDWILAENKRKGSVWHKRIDLKQVAASGHSCGGMQAIELAGDPRVRTLMVMYSGIFPPNQYLVGQWSFPPELTGRIHTPALYVVGNETDVGRAPALADFGRIAQAPVFLAGKRDAGHEGSFREPNGGAAAQVAVAWLKWQLRQDREAGSWFIGQACGLCANPAWEVMRKGW